MMLTYMVTCLPNKNILYIVSSGFFVHSRHTVGGLCSAFLDYIRKSTVVDFVFMSETDSFIQAICSKTTCLSVCTLYSLNSITD